MQATARLLVPGILGVLLLHRRWCAPSIPLPLVVRENSRRSLRIMAIGRPILSYKYLTFKWSVKRCQRAFFVAEVFCDCVVVWWSGVLDSVCALVGTALFNTTMRDWTVTTPAPAPTPRLCPSKLWRNTFPACVALRIVFRHSLSSSQFDFQDMTLAVF